MTKKLIFIIIIVAVVLSVGVYYLFIKDGNPTYILEKVVRGTITQDVSETGSVKGSEKTELGFRNSGRIKNIYVDVGDEVGAGQSLAQLDTAQLYIELDGDKADLEVAKAKNRDAGVSLESAEQSLEDVMSLAQEDLENAYGDALTLLDNSYLKVYNTYNTVFQIQRDYFIYSDQEAREVIEEKYKIKGNLERTEISVDNAKSDPQKENIDLTLSKVKGFLEAVSDSLEAVRDATKSTTYRESVSATDKTSLDTQRTNITNTITDIVNTQQIISTTKITNETNIHSAEASVSELKKQLEENKGSSGLYQAQIDQAQAKVRLLEDKITEAVLRAPSNGKITNINKRKGEVVQPANSVISFLSEAPFQIEVDIYEEDIVKVKIGDPVDIDLVSFPDQALEGKVTLIDPAEKIVEGVVYYKVTIDFLEAVKGIKPGMTADITIITNKKENVLVIPKGTVKKINGKNIVQVFKDGEIEEREIEIGLEGDDFIEVISGLEEGEEVFVGEKL